MTYGVMYLRSTLGWEAGPAETIRAWRLRDAVLTECTAAEAAELVGEREQTGFLDAFSVHTGAGEETAYPSEAHASR
ncbi:hypothetical protein E4K10_45565 [Streptomyces sp. T1317-0309]|nr:hypothetical protein E4K10_45565 [Streptomyces sp. T1317-0309]